MSKFPKASKGIPTREQIEKFYEGQDHPNLERRILNRHNEALIFYAQQRDEQIKKLKGYVAHTKKCGYSTKWTGWKNECTCGLEQALNQ